MNINTLIDSIYSHSFCYYRFLGTGSGAKLRFDRGARLVKILLGRMIDRFKSTWLFALIVVFLCCFFLVLDLFREWVESTYQHFLISDNTDVFFLPDFSAKKLLFLKTLLKISVKARYIHWISKKKRQNFVNMDENPLIYSNRQAVLRGFFRFSL